MAACEFEFDLPAAPEALLGALRADFARFGGEVAGDGGAGEFSLPTPLGEFRGAYRVAGTDAGGSNVRIEVESKPIFVPCSAIGEHLERRLHKAAAARGAPPPPPPPIRRG